MLDVVGSYCYFFMENYLTEKVRVIPFYLEHEANADSVFMVMYIHICIMYCFYYICVYTCTTNY